MNNQKFILREDNAPKIINDGINLIDIRKILKKEYRYIFDEIKKEDYFIEDAATYFFKEILFENKVVGFLAYEFNEHSLVINEFYIIPEFRGKGLFYSEIISLFKKGYLLSFKHPTKRIVEILMHYGFAEQVKNNIVVSALTFNVDSIDLNNIEGDYIHDDMVIASNIYDLNLCAVLYLHDLSLLNCEGIYYSDELENDICEYGYNENRDSLNQDYFDKIRTDFTNNQDKYIELVGDLEMKLPEAEFGFNKIIGDSEELSEYMWDLVQDDEMAYDKAVKIKTALTEEYYNGEVSDDGILTRLMYLSDPNPGDEAEAFDNLLEDRFSCPYCYNPLNSMEKSCPVCGYNLFYEDNDFELDDVKAVADFLENPDEVNFKNTSAMLKFISEDEYLSKEFFENDEDLHMLNEFFKLFEGNEELGQKMMELMVSEEDNLDDFEKLMDEVEGSQNFLNNINVYSKEPLNDFDFNSLGLNLNSPYPVAEMMWGDNNKRYKLDDTYYGKDYPISHEIYIFRILTSLKSHNNMKIACAVSGMDGAMTKNLVEKILFECNFISDEVNYDNWDEFANKSLTIPDLKDILRKNDLKVSGRKQELIDRIAENQIPLNEFRNEVVSVLPEGEEFLKNNHWIAFYDKFLNKFDFNDFLKYLDNNEGELLDVTFDYLGEHLEIAKMDENQTYIADCLMAKELVSKMGEDFLNKKQS